VHMHTKSHAVISQVGFALLSAFATFRAEMYPRLLLFFEGTLRGMLHEERKLRSSAKDGAEILNSQGALRVLNFLNFFSHYVVVYRALRRTPGGQLPSPNRFDSSGTLRGGSRRR